MLTTKTFIFYPSTTKPEFHKPLLIRYQKGKKSAWNGQIGTFLTQGIYNKGTNGDGFWFDYTDRLLRDDAATTSKNKIIEWAYID
jgi:hypothetical protein